MHFESDSSQITALPPNWGILDSANAVGQAAECGASLILTLSVGLLGRVKAARFKARGLNERLPALSRLVRSLEGRKFSEVETLPAEAVAAAAGLAGDGAAAGPVGDGGAVSLGVAALRAAGRHYRGEPPTPTPDADGDPLVCYCFGVSACQIRDAVRAHGLTSVSQVTERLSAGGGCGTCRREIKQILASAGVAASGPPGAASGPPWIAERRGGK